MTVRIYVASSVQTYNLTNYKTRLRAIRRQLEAVTPQVCILAARDMFSSNEDWRAKWPSVLRTVDVLVYFGYETFGRAPSIGYGVHTEIANALHAGKPVFYSAPDSQLYAHNQTCHIQTLEGGWRDYARVHVPRGASPLDSARLAAILRPDSQDADADADAEDGADAETDANALDSKAA